MAYLRNWHGLEDEIFQTEPTPDFENISDTFFDYVVLLTDMVGRWGTPEENYGMCGPMHGLFDDPSAALEYLFAHGYLLKSQATEELMIESRFSVAQLKELCGKYGLVKTGRHEELIQRLLDAGHRQDFLDLPPRRFLSASESGRALINALYQQRFTCEGRTFHALADRNIERALQIRMAYEKKWRVGSAYELLKSKLFLRESLQEINNNLADPSFENIDYWNNWLWDYTQLDAPNMQAFLEQDCPAWYIPTRFKKRRA